MTYGKVIVLQGTSSAGKSSIIHFLYDRLVHHNCIVLAVDDFFWQALIEQAEHFNFIDSSMELSEKKKIVMEHQDAIFPIFAKNNWIEPKKLLHRAIRQAAMQGKLVIVDTVLAENGGMEDYFDFCEQMIGIDVIKVQVYCSPIILAEHLVQRNNLNQHEERRDSVFVLKQYCNLYQPTQLSNCIDTISMQDIQNSLEIIRQDIEKLAHEKLEVLNNDDIHNQLNDVLALYKTTFNFCNDTDIIAVQSRLPYDFLINTGLHDSYRCAQLLYDIWLSQAIV